jgi:phage recombination protein Bet
MAKENNTQATVSQTLLGANDKGRVTYQVNGEDVNLSFQIVRNYLTRGQAAVSDAEVIQFISLCRANQLNPFIGDAYMVKYGNEPASMIISKAAFMKRAESAPQFAGYQAGVILLRDKQLVEQEGSFFLPGDTLVGGWAKVYRKDREHPVVARVRLVEYDKRKSTWAQMPGTMIRKVAIAQAFREAFPFAVQGMYTPEEMPDEQGQEAPVPANNIKPVFTEQDAPAHESTQAPEPEQPQQQPEPEPQPAPAQEPAPQQAQEEKLPWEDDEYDVPTDDADMDLFKA